jgi:hypothetical protein
MHVGRYRAGVGVVAALLTFDGTCARVLTLDWRVECRSQCSGGEDGFHFSKLGDSIGSTRQFQLHKVVMLSAESDGRVACIALTASAYRLLVDQTCELLDDG